MTYLLVGSGQDLTLASFLLLVLLLGFGALSTIGGAGIGQIVAFIGFLELAVMKDVTGESEFPGDFRNGFIDFGW